MIWSEASLFRTWKPAKASWKKDNHGQSLWGLNQNFFFNEMYDQEEYVHSLFFIGGQSWKLVRCRSNRY